MKKNTFKKGFTLVETMVAISILMLAVTGPLYFASESLKAAVYAKDQITAFYLAQDAVEQIRKIRDDNVYIKSNTAWETGLTGCGNWCLIAADFSISSSYRIDTPNPSDSAATLYIDNDGLYTHNTSGTKIPFIRKIKIEATDTTNPNDWTNATEMKITVYIKWKSRNVDREFEAVEFLRRINQ